MTTHLTWFGHSACQIEIDDLTILIDPFLSGSPTCSVKPDDLEPDYILVTHGHADHLGDTVAIAGRTGATVVGAFELVNWLMREGVQKTESMNIGGQIELPNATVRMVPARHSSSMPDGTYAGEAAGFVIQPKCRRSGVTGPTIYHAGDTGLMADFQIIGQYGIDVAMLPIGDRFTMGPADAIRAIRLLEPKRVIPIHHSTWPPIQQDATAWSESVCADTFAQPIILKPGQRIELTEPDG